MVRRSLVMVLAACLLLTQSAAVLGHAHAGLRLKGHDPRPHIHTTALGCGHNHAEPDEGEDEQDTTSRQHDDTVLISIQDSLAGERGGANVQPEASPSWVVFNRFDFSIPHIKTNSPPRGRSHPPDHPCPRYVLNLALLI